MHHPPIPWILFKRSQLPWRSLLSNGQCINSPLQVDEEQKPMNYSQSFQLLPDGAGSYFVFNDVFRLIYSAA